jgi:hypothetical protein
MSLKITLPVWAVSITAIACLAFGLCIGVNLPPEVKPVSREIPSREIYGGSYVIVYDPYLPENTDYSVRYSPNAASKDQWMNHTSTFKFRRESTARKLHDEIMSLIRVELARAGRED